MDRPHPVEDLERATLGTRAWRDGCPPEVEQFIIFNPGELHLAQCLTVCGEGGEPKFIIEDLGVILLQSAERNLYLQAERTAGTSWGSSGC